MEIERLKAVGGEWRGFGEMWCCACAFTGYDEYLMLDVCILAGMIKQNIYIIHGR